MKSDGWNSGHSPCLIEILPVHPSLVRLPELWAFPYPVEALPVHSLSVCPLSVPPLSVHPYPLPVQPLAVSPLVDTLGPWSYKGRGSPRTQNPGPIFRLLSSAGRDFVLFR